MKRSCDILVMGAKRKALEVRIDCMERYRRTNDNIFLLGNDYWHRNDDPQERINCFKPFGFDTLIIWSWELKDIETLTNKIIAFNSKEIT